MAEYRVHARRVDDHGSLATTKQAEITLDADTGGREDAFNPAELFLAAIAACMIKGIEYGFNARGEIQLEKKEDMKKRCLASPDIADALALTFAAPNTSFAWDLAAPVQEYCITEYDLYRDFTDEYWDEKDEY